MIGPESLAGYYKELPIIVEDSQSIVDLILNEPDRSMSVLNLIVSSLPLNSKEVLQQALWKVVEITFRQGVLPLIVEVNRFGNPVERCEN